MRRPPPQLPSPQLGYIPCVGGYDSETPGWSVKDGALRAALNYEIGVNGGYQDIMGYERFDGRAAPSAAIYATVPVTPAGVAVGDTITQDTSGATAYVVLVDSGASPYLVLTIMTGAFTATDVYRVGGGIVATPSEIPTTSGASTSSLDAQYTNLAADVYRALITACPGEDEGLGVFGLAGTIYAMRNAVGGATAAIYKSTSSGWSLVALGRRVAFTSGGTYTMAEGDTITGATSGATAVITRVLLQTGTYGAGTAAGWIIFASQTGTFQAENLNVGGNLNVATIAGNSSAITLAPGGSLKTWKTTFEGAYETERVYGADGANLGWEFDGTVFAPIPTGMTVDTPHNVIEHLGHLFFAFGRSAQHSGIGTPYAWTLLTGADEILTQSTITGFAKEPGTQHSGALSITTTERLYTLYGTSSINWQLVSYREEIGAIANSVQQVAQTMFVSDAGLTTLAAAQEYGNFQHATLSDRVLRYFVEKRGAIASSVVCRDKNQYRIFFTDGSGMYVTMSGRKAMGFMPVQYGAVPLHCYREKTSTGVERLFFIDADGYVMQMDRGTSFDGDNIDAYFSMHFSFLKAFGIIKKYLSAYVELQGTGYAEYMARHDVAYATSEQLQSTQVTNDVELSGQAWDTGGTWDAGGTWDPQSIIPQRIRLGGEGENLSMDISKASDYMTPLLFTGFRIRYTARRQLR